MGTQIVKLACQGCGADLSVNEDIRFVTCKFCGSKLEVVHDRTVSHTRLLEGIADDLKLLKLQNELEQLDREWASLREGFMVSGKDGHRSIPNAGASVFGGALAIVFGIVWMAVASSMGAPGIFPLFGLVFIAVAVFGMVSSTRKAGAHRSAGGPPAAARGTTASDRGGGCETLGRVSSFKFQVSSFKPTRLRTVRRRGGILPGATGLAKF
ncbi:hypothetical protein BH23VER1_BH23VER1_30320 [soil metagenome]